MKLVFNALNLFSILSSYSFRDSVLTFLKKAEAKSNENYKSIFFTPKCTLHFSDN